MGALLALYLPGRISPVQAATGIPDAVVGVLFWVAFLKTRAHQTAGYVDFTN